MNNYNCVTCRLSHSMGCDTRPSLAPDVSDKCHLWYHRRGGPSVDGRGLHADRHPPDLGCCCCFYFFNQHWWWLPCYAKNVRHVQETR